MDNIRKAILQQKKEELVELKNKLEKTIETLIEAEGAVSTNPENQKREYVMEVNKIGHKIKKTDECLRILENLPRPSSHVGLGSIVTLENLGGKYNIFIIPKPQKCGVCTFKINDREIICVSPESPLPKKILNKKQGEIINYKGKYKIISIQ